MTQTQRLKPELLMPAGSLEVFRTAVDYGADAVYLGADSFSLRAKAHNFSKEDIREAVAYAHAHKDHRGGDGHVRVFITVNIFAHNDDIERADDFLREIGEVGPDALIISDPGLFMKARKILPDMELHVSTQANNTNYETYNFWYALGARRVVSARELSMRELSDIRRKIPSDMELESFVHGAMCISYSGRCLLSNALAGRDANQGACTHPCRWKYALVEETRPGEYMPVEEDARGTYIMNSRDLCMIEHIPELVETGIDSLKVEGRMKTALYVASVARAYRQALDDYFESPEIYNARLKEYVHEVGCCTTRKFTTGFYFGKPDRDSQIYDNNTYEKGAVYLGRIREVRNGKTIQDAALCEVLIEQKNKFSVGDVLEIMAFDGTSIRANVLSITTVDGEARESAPHPKELLWIGLDQPAACGELMRFVET